jgi:heme/copper-type cytochrome/quinol oxidase subunit 2
VTASTSITPVQPRRSGLSTATQAAAGTAFALFLALVGISFVALAAAFPLVVPMIQDQHLPVSARDFEMAKAFASVWWIFAGVGVATLVAALVTAVKLVEHLDPQPSE